MSGTGGPGATAARLPALPLSLNAPANGVTLLKQQSRDMAAEESRTRRLRELVPFTETPVRNVFVGRAKPQSWTATARPSGEGALRAPGINVAHGESWHRPPIQRGLRPSVVAPYSQRRTAREAEMACSADAEEVRDPQVPACSAAAEEPADQSSSLRRHGSVRGARLLVPRLSRGYRPIRDGVAGSSCDDDLPSARNSRVLDEIRATTW